jgi:hypothetical protein
MEMGHECGCSRQLTSSHQEFNKRIESRLALSAAPALKWSSHAHLCQHCDMSSPIAFRDIPAPFADDFLAVAETHTSNDFSGLLTTETNTTFQTTIMAHYTLA